MTQQEFETRTGINYARAEVSFKYWFPSTNDYRPG